MNEKGLQVYPEPLAPIGGEAVNGHAVRFLWKEVSGATAYTLQIAADEAFADIRFNARIKRNWFQVSRLFSLDDAIYFWRVRSEAADGTSDFSEPAAFRCVSAVALENARLASTKRRAPAPIGPVGSTPVDAAAVPFHWTYVPSAINYRLQIAADRGFVTPVFDQALGSCTSLTLHNLFRENGSTFFWRVQSKDRTGAMVWSPAASFRPVADEVAETFSLKQEAARAEANRQNAVREARQAAAAAESEPPYLKGTTGSSEYLFIMLAILFSVAFMFYLGYVVVIS